MKARFPVAAALVALLLPLAAGAHSSSTAMLDIARQPDRSIALELDIAVRDLALTLPLDADRDEVVTWGELRAVEPAVFALADAHLGLATASGDCGLQRDGYALRQYEDGARVALQWRGTCPGAGGPLRVHYDLFLDRDDTHRLLATVRDGERTASAVLRANAVDATLGARTGSPLLAFLREGVGHILAGYDHLAFLLCLLLPAALVRDGGRWSPAPGLGASLRGVAAIVTAFTLAHSITLALAALEWVTPSSRWVEAAIAGSVVLAAANNLWPIVGRRAWAMGFGFGLVHGFGFAGALGELGLPDDARLASLVGFNAGVELGQLAVVAVVVPLLFALRRRAAYSRFAMPLVSAAIAVAAGVVCWQRIVV